MTLQDLYDNIKKFAGSANDVVQNTANFIGQPGTAAGQGLRNFGSQVQQNIQYAAPSQDQRYDSNVPQFFKNMGDYQWAISKAMEGAKTVDYSKNVQNPIGKFAIDAVTTPINAIPKFINAVGDAGQVAGQQGGPTASDLARIGGKSAGVGLDLMSLYGGGAAAKTVGAESLGKIGLQQAIKDGLITGAKAGGGFGLAYGASQGIQQGDNLPDQFKNMVEQAGLQGLFGAGIGAISGGAIGGAGHEIGAIGRDVMQARNPETILNKNQKYINTGSLISSDGSHPKMVDPNFFNPESLLGKGIMKLEGGGLSIRDVATGASDIPGQMKVPPVRTTMNKEIAAIVRKNLKAGKEPFAGVDQPIPAENAVERGLVSSVKTSGNPNITPEAKLQTNGTYIPKANADTLGEAQALLTEGGSIDFHNVKDLDKKVMATIQQAINLDKQGNHQAAANLYNNLSIHGTELGRGVQAFSMLDKMSPEALSLSLAGHIKKYNATHSTPIPELGPEHQQMISDFISKIDGLPAGREKNIAINEFNKQLSNLFPSSFADKAITVWKAGLLTSLRTHERNLLGNAVMLGSEVAKDLPATLADKAMSIVTKQRTVTPTLSGMREFGSKETRQQIKDLVMRGYDPSEDVGKFDVHRNITWANTPIQKFLKGYTEAVFRPLGAEDKAFFNAAFKRSLYDQAGAEAINAGKKGDAEFIKSLVSSPNENMLANATKDANYATFHDKTALSGLATSGKQFLSRQQGLKGEVGKLVSEMVAPFTGVPSSIVGKTVAYSPLGLIRGVYHAGKVMVKNVPELQRQAAQEIGRGTMGSGMFALGSYLMSKGLMTGQPKDAKEADLWAAQGKQANSVLVGGKWRSINSIGPQNLVVLAGAKYNEEMNKPDGSFGEYAMGLGKDQLSQTFLQGVQGPLNALSDPGRYGANYFGNQLSSGVPNIIKDMSKAGDTVQRENNTPLDFVTNSIPGLRNQNIEKRDVMGQPLPQEPTGAAAFYDLFNSKEQRDTPVTSELNRLYNSGNDATPSRLQKSQTVYGQKLKLSPQELNTFEGASGAQMQPMLQQIITSPQYQGLSDEDKKSLIDKIVTDSKKNAKQQLFSGQLQTNDSSNVAGQSAAALPGGFDPSQLKGKYNVQMNKDAFASSDQNFVKKDGYVYRKGIDGTVTAVTENQFNSQMNDAKLTNQKKNLDMAGWQKTAEDQFQTLQNQLQDPNVDELDRTTIQNKIETLVAEYQKYKQYGGFTKGKAGKKTKPLKINLAGIIKKVKTTTPKLAKTSVKEAPLRLPKIVASKPLSSTGHIQKIKLKPSVSTIPGAKRLA